jgi:ribosome recycling factor
MNNKNDVIYLDIEEVLGGKGVDINLTDLPRETRRKDVSKVKTLSGQAKESAKKIHATKVKKLKKKVRK